MYVGDKQDEEEEEEDEEEDDDDDDDDFMCTVEHAINKTGSSSDDWIY
jgi:hypothetical protein